MAIIFQETKCHSVPDEAYGWRYFSIDNILLYEFRDVMGGFCKNNRLFEEWREDKVRFFEYNESFGRADVIGIYHMGIKQGDVYKNME